MFALTGTGAFGVAYDLVVARLQHRANDQANDQPTDQVEAKKPEQTHYPQALAVGVLAAVFAVVMGNLGTVLVEMPYQTCALPSGYFRWVDLDERDNLPQSQGPDGSTICGTSKSLDPSVWSNSSYFWWWFRYSRVIRDNNLDGTPIGVQPISEFPQFSFVLSDMHPHVLALPFAVLAIGLAFNLVLHKRELESWEVLLYAIFVGGMIFLNSWDAVYLGLIVGAEALRRLLKNGTGRLESADWWGLFRFGLALVGLTAILYLPFFLSFRSQAGGILPNVIWPTQFQQFFIMFGPFLVVIGVFLAVERWRAGATFNAAQGFRAVGGLLLVLLGVVILICLAFILLAVTNPDSDVVHSISSAFGLAAPDPLATTALRLSTALRSISEILGRRLQGFLTEGFLLVVMFVVVARLFARAPQTADGEPAVTRRVITYSPATGFALLLIAAGAVLTLAPDFVYLRDDFGVRINTVFKLYYQGWMLWSVACAYGLWSVVFDRAEQPAPTLVRRALGAVTVVLVGMCLVYPIYAITSRTFAENGRIGTAGAPLTLDGTASLAVNDDDFKTIECLASIAHSDNDVVAEAADKTVAYKNEYGRVSGLTGIPTLIGWENHEQQWRGSTFNAAANIVYDSTGKRVGGRTESEATLYNSTNWADAQTVIQQYGITYIYVGPTERRIYDSAGLAKFATLTPVCSSGDVAVYATDSIGALAVPAGR